MNDVRKAEFGDSGTALFTVDDYYQIAAAAAQKTQESLQINVVWNPSGLKPHWTKWSYAHVEVDLVRSSEMSYRTFRQFLADRCKQIIPPY